jgi:hypothetical protein
MQKTNVFLGVFILLSTAVVTVNGAVLHFLNRTTPKKEIKIVGYKIDVYYRDMSGNHKCSHLTTPPNFYVPYGDGGATDDNHMQDCRMFRFPISMTIKGPGYPGSETEYGIDFPDTLLGLTTADDVYIDVYDNYVRIGTKVIKQQANRKYPVDYTYYDPSGKVLKGKPTGAQ